MSITFSPNTLIYAGASTDNILDANIPSYDKYILYDLLPNSCCLYKQYEAGYELTRDEDIFFNKLKENYGEFEINYFNPNLLYFPKHNIYYYINTNANHLEPPQGDIYVKDCICEEWIELYINRKVLIDSRSWAPTAIFQGEFQIIENTK